MLNLKSYRLKKTFSGAKLTPFSLTEGLSPA